MAQEESSTSEVAQAEASPAGAELANGPMVMIVTETNIVTKTEEDVSEPSGGSGAVSPNQLAAQIGGIQVAGASVTASGSVAVWLPPTTMPNRH